jgi:hypothetical protein
MSLEKAMDAAPELLEAAGRRLAAEINEPAV